MIRIPSTLWQVAVKGLSDQPPFERVCYFDGVELEIGDGVVTTVTFPDADLKAGHFRVSASAMSEAGRHLRRFGLVRLAQLHTHPEGWVGHSSVDDERAYSQTPGSLSIVLPDSALTAPGLGDVGVHRRERRRWRELSPDEVRAALEIVPSLIDWRR